jgi:hypothetical protein
MPPARCFVFAVCVLTVLSIPRAVHGQVRLGAELQVNLTTSLDQSQPHVAMASSGAFVVVWYAPLLDSDIVGRRFSVTGAPLTGELQINAYTISQQRRPDVAVASDGGFIAVWEGPSGPGQSSILGRRFSSTGAPVAGEFQVSNDTVSFKYNAAIGASASGDFVVAWVSDGGDGDSGGVFARRLSSAGATLANEFQINTRTVGYQGFPDVAVGDNGEFVVVWAGPDDGSDYGVFARRFSSNGSALASEFQVNSYTSGTQFDSAVAFDANGDVVIVWDSARESSTKSVFARRFDATGSAVGDELQVNTFTTWMAGYPDVALEGDGDFVVAWDASGQDGGDYGVFARLFSSAGTPLASEFQVNSYTASNQFRPSIGLSGSRFVIAWQSDGQDGSNRGVFAQRFVTSIIFDIDGNGVVEALADGLLGLRYAFGFRGATLVTGAVGAGCTRCDASSIEAYLESMTN